MDWPPNLGVLAQRASSPIVFRRLEKLTHDNEAGACVLPTMCLQAHGHLRSLFLLDGRHRIFSMLETWMNEIRFAAHQGMLTYKNMLKTRNLGRSNVLGVGRSRLLMACLVALCLNAVCCAQPQNRAAQTSASFMEVVGSVFHQDPDRLQRVLSKEAPGLLFVGESNHGANALCAPKGKVAQARRALQKLAHERRWQFKLSR